MLGSGIGLVLGGAYWMGEKAQSDVARVRAARLADAAAEGFSARALQAEMKAMGPGAVALAQRQDPFVGDALRGRQGSEVITRFGAHDTAPHLSVMTVSLTTTHPSEAVPAPHAPVVGARSLHFGDGGALGSARDLACLTDAVYYEARGEGRAGQAAVAQVVLNRVRHPAFPKSVCGVVFQRAESGDGCQFSFVCDGSMRHQREPGAWRRAEEVAARALDGTVMSAIGNATHFHVAGVDPGWGSHLMRVAQVGLHVFYRFGGRGGGSQHSAPADESLPAPAAPTGQFILASAITGPASPSASPALPAPAAPAAKPAPGKAETPAKAPADAPVSTARPASIS
jgi:hypothetical protein